MAQLIPIELEDGTVIHIQAVEEVSSSPSGSVIPGSNAQESEPKRGLFTTDPQKQGTKSFDPIEKIIRAYTTHLLNSFKNLATAEVSEVTLEFGINVGGMTGIPYIATGSSECNVKIAVKCVFPKK
jgi:hypothetical protein